MKFGSVRFGKHTELFGFGSVYLGFGCSLSISDKTVFEISVRDVILVSFTIKQNIVYIFFVVFLGGEGVA